MKPQDQQPERPVVGDDSIRRRWLPVILGVALLLRVIAAFAVDHKVSSLGQSFLIEGDANGYWELAQKVASGQPYELYSPPRRILRVPGFPLLLAASIRLFGDSILAARIVLAVVGTLCCWLTYSLGKQTFRPAVGLAAAGFVAVNPLHVGNSVLILSETWFTFWMLLSLLCLNATLRSSTSSNFLRNASVTGILVGFTSLIRPGFLPWLFPSALATCVVFRGADFRLRRTRLLGSVLVIVGCVAAMAPWAIRNHRATGHLVFTSLWSGPSLYDGLNPEADGTSNMQFFEDDRVMASMSEFEMNGHYRDRAIDFVKQNPAKTLELAGRKALLFLSPVPNFVRQRSTTASIICIAFWVIVVFGCVLAVFRSSLSLQTAGLLIGPFLLFLLVHMVFVGSVRYRFPVEFPLSVVAAAGWLRLRQTETFGE